MKSILTYVRDVLGVESFAPVASGALPPRAPKVQVKPFVFLSSGSSGNQQLTEMQTRMVAALKLNPAEFEFVDIESTNVQVESLSEATVVVVFGESARQKLNLTLKTGETTQLGNAKVIITHSLQDLTTSAALKKETWTHLQSAF